MKRFDPLTTPEMKRFWSALLAITIIHLAVCAVTGGVISSGKDSLLGFLIIILFMFGAFYAAMPIVALWFLISGARKGSAGTALAPVAFFLAWGVIAGINYISVIMDNRPKYMDKLPEQFIENIKKSNLILIGENNWHAQAIRLLGSELVKEFTATTKKSDGRVLLEQARIGKDGECKGAIIPNSQKYLDDAGRPDECFFIVELGSYPDGALLWFSPSSDGTETTGYFRH